MIERMLASNNDQFYNPPIYTEVFNAMLHKTKEHVGSFTTTSSVEREKSMVMTSQFGSEYLDEDE